MYNQLWWRSDAQALGHMWAVQPSPDPVTSIFWSQLLQIVRKFSSQIKFIKTNLVDSSDRDWKSRVEVPEVKPSSFQHVPLQQKCLLLLLHYLWHYNRYFAFTHSTVEKTSKHSCHHECLHYGKMEAVSIRCMRTGSHAHLIVLITFGTP